MSGNAHFHYFSSYPSASPITVEKVNHRVRRLKCFQPLQTMGQIQLSSSAIYGQGLQCAVSISK